MIPQSTVRLFFSLSPKQEKYMATAISIADKVVRPTSDTAGVEDGDVYGCSSLDRRNADKSGAEMRGGGVVQSCVYVAESSYIAFCSQIIISSLAQTQLLRRLKLKARCIFRKLRTRVLQQRFIEV